MKRIFTFLIVIITSLPMSYSQYYSLSRLDAGINPGGLNTDAEQPVGAVVGWNSILAANVATWSANQTIPFPFNFNGSPVTSYKVARSGVLTFDVAAVAVPGTTNGTLPSASIPDNSVCVWGLTNTGANDQVGVKTFGTTPNRQHWISFLSYSSPTASGTQWTYWSIVLEEGSDNIYIVDQRTFNTPLSLTLGVQINDSTAFSITGAPNTDSRARNGGNDSDPTDNTYYEFRNGTQPEYDAAMSSVDLPSKVSENSLVTISGTILNDGSKMIDTLTINWSVNGTANSDTLTGLGIAASGGDYDFQHSVQWTAASPGSYTSIDVWTSNPNGNADGAPSNDSLTGDVFVDQGTPSTNKKVLLEEYTTAPCQFCPDGAVIVEQIRSGSSNVIATGVHAGFGTDAMTIPAHSTWAARFATGAPTAMVDRVLFDGEPNVAHGRGTWQVNSDSRLTAESPLDVDVEIVSYNHSTRATEIDVDVKFVDYAEPGDLRLTVMILEDNVTGVGSGYNQVNFYNTQPGHQYTGAGNPIVGYAHRHVVRELLTPTWGEQNLFSSTSPGDSITETYNFTLSNNYDPNEVSFVAFVSNYDATDDSRVFVHNANDAHLRGKIVGIEETEISANEFNVYPNPFEHFTNLNFNLEESKDVEVHMYDVMGKLVYSNDFGRLNSGNHNIQLDADGLSSGAYFLRITVDEEYITKTVYHN